MSDYVDLPVKDRMKMFLFNEEMADVHFLVGTDGVKELIPAYKVLLATASEVFHGQLYGRFDVPEPIEVVDTTPEIFKTMLRYIYTDKVDLAPDNVFPVLYLGKKYLLNNLVAHVSTYIVIAYSDQRIVKVLPHLRLVDGENSESVWHAIDLYADVVLKSPEFLELDHAVLCDILRRDLNVDELAVFNGALAWAQAECQRKRFSFETDAREVLGNALKLIRFPLMSIEEFASGPANSSVLSYQEKLEIYKWYGLRSNQELTTFSSTPRCSLLSCNRYESSSIVNRSGGSWSNSGDYKQWLFTFSVSTSVRFHGVALFGRRDESNVYEVNLSLLNASSVVASVNACDYARKGHYGCKRGHLQSAFWAACPVPGTQYKVTALSIGPTSLYAENGLREVTCDHGSSATFSFTDTELRHTAQYDISLKGHIPTIYVSFR